MLAKDTIMRSRLLAGVVAALTSVAVPAAAQDATTTVTIDAGKTGPKIARDIFGQFAEHLGTGIYGGVWVGEDSEIPNVRGIRSDVVAALREIRVPNVRWPGGCFADEYHWRDGIGDRAQRGVSINWNWGEAIEDNAFGTHEFFDFVEQIGSEAYVSINVGSMKNPVSSLAPPPWTIVALRRASSRYALIFVNDLRSITAPMNVRKSRTSPIFMSRIIATTRSRTSGHSDCGM